MNEPLTDQEIYHLSTHLIQENLDVEDRELLPRLIAEVRELRKWRAFTEGRVLSAVQVLQLGGISDMSPRQILENIEDRIVAGGCDVDALEKVR